MFEAANDAVFSEQPAQHGVAATRGHCAGNGGLRGHSVGGVFPCVMFQRGNPHHGPLTHGFRSPDGIDHEGFATFDDAYLAAGIWLDNRPVSFEPQVGV